MATSGNFLTSDSGHGGGNYYGRMIFEWWQTSSGISGSVGYHNISYHLKTYGGSSGYWQYFYNGSMNVDGAGYSWGTTQAYGAGATVFGDYSATLYTDSSGNRSFGASAQGAIYSAGINTSGSGSWSLDNIPLHAGLNGLSTDQGGIAFTDEGPAWVEFVNPAGTSVSAFIDTSIGRAVTASGVGSRYNFVFNSALQQAIQQGSVNSNTYNINMGIFDSLGGSTVYDYRTRSGSIANDHGQANPVFTNFTFADANTTTATLTGNNQYLVQGQSDLQVTVSTANKATPQKYATMDHYTVNIGGYSANAAYSSSSNVVKDVGVVSDVTGVQNISTTAVDSRGNAALVTKSTTVLPYAAPVVQATAIRNNGYDDALILTVTGSVSPLRISSTDKNVVNSTSGAQYRSIADGGDITGVSWTNVANTQTAITGVVNGNSTITVAAAGSTSATHSYQIQVRIIDGLFTTTQTINIAAGVPIFRIGLDKMVYNNEQGLMPSHVGMVIHSTTLSTAGAVQAIYAGTWAAFGAGQFLVGKAGSGTFATAGATGGEETHTLSASEMPVHNHGINDSGHTHNQNITNGTKGGSGSVGYNADLLGWSHAWGSAGVSTDASGTGISIQNAGSGAAHNNLPPFTVVYMWTRTA